MGTCGISWARRLLLLTAIGLLGSLALSAPALADGLGSITDALPTSGTPLSATVDGTVQPALPAVQATTTALGSTAPVADGTAPAAQPTGPVAQAVTPVVQAAAPIAQATAPVLEATSHVLTATAPVVDMATTTVVETTAPLLEAAGAAVEGTAPLLASTTTLAASLTETVPQVSTAAVGDVVDGAATASTTSRLPLPGPVASQGATGESSAGPLTPDSAALSATSAGELAGAHAPVLPQTELVVGASRHQRADLFDGRPVDVTTLGGDSRALVPGSGKAGEASAAAPFRSRHNAPSAPVAPSSVTAGSSGGGALLLIAALAAALLLAAPELSRRLRLMLVPPPLPVALPSLERPG